MRQHFPEIIGLTFAGAVVAIFVFASALGSPAVVLGAAGIAGLAAFAYARLARRRA